MDAIVPLPDARPQTAIELLLSRLADFAQGRSENRPSLNGSSGLLEAIRHDIANHPESLDLDDSSLDRTVTDLARYEVRMRNPARQTHLALLMARLLVPHRPLVVDRELHRIIDLMRETETLAASGEGRVTTDLISSLPSGHPVHELMWPLKGREAEPAVGHVALLALHLADLDPKVARHTTVSVALVDRPPYLPQRGLIADLELEELTHGPAGAFPHPSAMFGLATSTPLLGEAIERARRNVDPDGSRSFRWKVTIDGQPATHIDGPSLAAGWAVAATELSARRGRRPRLRAVSTRSAITGDVRDDGRLGPVEGVALKSEAAQAAGKVAFIYPEENCTDLKEARSSSFARIPVDTIADAYEEGRTAFDRSIGVIAVASLIIFSLLAVGVVQYRRFDDRRRADQLALDELELIGVADGLAEQARDRAGTSADGEALLLAMVADDLYAQAGRTSDTVADVQGRSRAPLRIIRPTAGPYTNGLSSSSGRYVMTTTSTGTGVITDALTGAKVFSRSFPPGLQVDPNQIYYDAIASNPRTDLFAAALSTREILLLVPQENSVFPMSAIPMNVPSRGERIELNRAKLLAFSSDGSALVAFGGSFGLLEFDLARSTDGPDRTCPSSAAFQPIRIVVGEDRTVTGLLENGTLVRQDLSTCAVTDVRSHMGSAEAQDVALTDDGVLVLGASGKDLISIGADGEESVLASDGPYEDIRFGSSATIATASTSDGPVSLLVPGGVSAQFPTGSLVADHLGALWLHDGLVEVFRQGVDFSAAYSFRSNSVNAALSRNRIMEVGLSWVSVSELAEEPNTSGARLPSPTLEGIEAQRISDPALTADGKIGLVLSSAEDATSRNLTVWDVDSGETLSVEAPPEHEDASVNTARFVDQQAASIVIGYRSGRLDLVRRAEGSTDWISASHLQFEGAILSSVVSQDGTRAYVLTAGGSATEAVIEVVEIGPRGLRVRSRRQIERPSGTTGKLVLTDDGSLIVLLAGGGMQRFSPSLTVEATGELAIENVLVATALPGRDVMIVSDTRTSALVSTRTLRTESGQPGAGPFGYVTSAERFESNLVTTHFLATEPRVTVWNLSKEGSRSQACQAIGRDLSKTEWQRLVGNRIPYDPPCRDHLKYPKYTGSIATRPTPKTPLLTPATGACPEGEALGGRLDLRLVRTAAGAVVGCEEHRAVVELDTTYDGYTLDPLSARVVTTDDDQVGWYLVVSGIDEDGDPMTVAGVQYGIQTVDRTFLGATDVHTVSRPPHTEGQSVPLIGIVSPESGYTAFLPRVYELGGSNETGSTLSVGVSGGFSWPAAIEG